VEAPADVAHLAEQALEHVLIRLAAGVALDRLAGHGAEVLVSLIASGDADQLEALRQCSLVGQVVKRREQLAVSQVACATEYHQHRRMDREPLEPLSEGVLARLLVRQGGCHYAFFTACPPNWLRSAASILAV